MAKRALITGGLEHSCRRLSHNVKPRIGFDRAVATELLEGGQDEPHQPSLANPPAEDRDAQGRAGLAVFR